MDAITTPETRRVKLLRRYTDLTAAIDLLTHRRIVLLDPASWDDRNDSHFIRQYQALTGAQSVLALCLSTVGETYHHWRVFCGHASGVCIEFDRKSLLAAVKKAPGLRSKEVDYLQLGEIRDRQLELKDLPFIKRWAFRFEKEYRFIYENASEKEPIHPIPVPLAAVRGITLSPWLPPSLLEGVRDLLTGIPGCEGIQVSRSELIGNDQWMANADRFLADQNLSASTVASELPTLGVR